MLVVFVLLVGVHPVSDEFVHEAAFICAVIALAGVLVLATRRCKAEPRSHAPGEEAATSAPRFSSSPGSVSLTPTVPSRPALIGGVRPKGA